MSERDPTTTSISILPETSRTAAGSDAKTLFTDSHGKVDVSNLLVSTREYSKKLPYAVDEPYITPSATVTPRPRLDDLDAYEASQESEQRSERVARELGRNAVTRFFKRIDLGIAYGTGYLISKIPRVMSMDERAEYQQKLNKDYADQDGDSWLRRRLNSFQRNRLNIRDRLPIYGIGALALARYGAPHLADFGVDAAHSISEATDHAVHSAKDGLEDAYNYIAGPRKVTTGSGDGYDMAASVIDYAPVERTYTSKAILIGGRGDTASMYLYNTMDSQDTINAGAQTVDSPAGIAPVDPVRMDVSAEIAADGAQEMFNPNDPSQQTIYGFSEGTAGAIDAYNQIVDANGGVKPDNLNLVIIGSPYAQGGFFHNNYTGTVAPILDSMGIPVDKPVPAGATVVYSPNDIWANGDNQSFLGMMSQLADVGVGHKIPDLNSDNFYQFVDSDGVTHMILRDQAHPLVELAEANGIPLPPKTSELLQQIAPVNQGFSQEVPQPNAYKAFDIGADIINEQTHSPAGTILMNNVPQNVKDLSQSTLVAVNNIPNTVTAMTNGQMSPQEGVPIVMNQLNDVAQDIGKVLHNPGKAIQDMVHGVANDAMQSAGLPPLPEQAPAPASAPAPAVPNIAAPVQEFQQNVQQFAQNWQNALSHLGGK